MTMLRVALEVLLALRPALEILLEALADDP